MQSNRTNPPPRSVCGYTGGSDYGRAVMDRNAAEDLAREAYANGDMKLRDEMLAEYRAAKARVAELEPKPTTST